MARSQRWLPQGCVIADNAVRCVASKVAPPCLLNKWQSFTRCLHSAEGLPFADADGTNGHGEVAPSPFHPFLLARRGDPGALSAVAPRAGGDEILQAGGSALGPLRVEMVAVLSRPGTTAGTPHPSQSGPPARAMPSRRCWRLNRRTGSRRRTSWRG
jgi:hypothetical protein